MDGDKADEKKEEEKKEEPEPEFQVLSNPSRVVKQQEKVIKFEHEKIENQHYSPVLSDRFAGFVILKEVENWVAKEDEVKEVFYDDEEKDEAMPNPKSFSDMDLPAAFEFDAAYQDAHSTL